jgi:putative NADH-flavin reductase
MHLLVFGPTGGTGRALVAQALEAGHHVTAFVRNPDKMAPRHHERLRLVAGDAASAGPSVGESMRGQEVVISALGVSKSFTPNGLIEKSVTGIIAAMQSHNVRRLIFTSALGVGETMSQTPLPLRIFMRLLLKKVYADKLAGESLIRRSGLEWTIVQPALLTSGPLTGSYRVGERLALSGFAKISRADTAHFLLSQLSDRTYLKKTVIVAY